MTISDKINLRSPSKPNLHLNKSLIHLISRFKKNWASLWFVETI